MLLLFVFFLDGAESDTGQMRKPVPVMRSLDGWISAGSNTLRPWVQNSKYGFLPLLYVHQKRLLLSNSK